MKRSWLLLGLALTFTMLSASPAGAVSGEIRMTLHTHSDPDPNFSGLMFPSDRLSYAVVPGEDFSYSSRLCSGNAPFNDVGLDFLPNYPGIDDDADGKAKVRHRIQGTVINSNGTQGWIQGRITTVVCAGTVPSPHVLVSTYDVQFNRISNNALTVWGGFQLSPTESTGTVRDIQGGGRMEGRFTCLSAPSCEARGQFTDFVGHSGDPSLGPGLLQPGLVGSYNDPTVTTGGSPSA